MRPLVILKTCELDYDHVLWFPYYSYATESTTYNNNGQTKITNTTPGKTRNRNNYNYS